MALSDNIFQICPLPPVDFELIQLCRQVLNQFQFIGGILRDVTVLETERSKYWVLEITSMEKFFKGPIPSFRVPNSGYVPFPSRSNIPVMKKYMKFVCPPHFKIPNDGVSITSAIRLGDGDLRRGWRVVFEEPLDYEYGDPTRNPFVSGVPAIQPILGGLDVLSQSRKRKQPTLCIKKKSSGKIVKRSKID